MELTPKQFRKFSRLQRKFNVSTEFLKSNLHNIEKFLWYAISPRITIRIVALRKGKQQRIVLNYHYLRRMVFDQMNRKYIKIRKRNVQEWSWRMVSYLRNHGGIKEFVEDVQYASPHPKDADTLCSSTKTAEDVTKQLKEQLELLRSGKRTVPLIEDTANVAVGSVPKQPKMNDEEERNKRQRDEDEAMNTNEKTTGEESSKQRVPMPAGDSQTVLEKTDSLQSKLETTPEKQIMPSRSECFLDSLQNSKPLKEKSGTELSESELQEPLAKKSRTSTPAPASSENEKAPSLAASGGRNFLDMLMNKVGAKNLASSEPLTSSVINESHPSTPKSTPPSASKSHDSGHLTDSSDEFFGFDETERKPGMMLTPIVPFCAKSKSSTNSVFISETLNEYMRENSLEGSHVASDEIEGVLSRRHRQANLDGLVTPGCTPPPMYMPLVPESLQKLRTVAERRLYLQKFNKNHKLAIINNEATIYRELQRKTTSLQKSKRFSQQLLQAPNSQMPFTRQGWRAASFVSTEFNKYYYQMLQLEESGECVRLPGVRGNNDERYKRAYCSRVAEPQHCSENCVDLQVWRDFKPIKTLGPSKKKLNKSPLASVFKPCPLSHKPYQKPLDDETAALLLAGGSMAVVRMPTVELQVYPTVGKPLHEVAKRYLEYILPHHDISREWAEFSVSTLQQPCTMKETEEAVATTCTPERRKSFTFVIPYLNDRNHILVRRVVDRSEKLDQSFELAKESDSETATVDDLKFRENLDTSDSLLMDCADVVSDLINSVAISCSENSFIKEDPDALYGEELPEVKLKPKLKTGSHEEQEMEQRKATANKKQNRLLSELRRLNATIIDAAVKTENGVKQCRKDFCTLGCVCSSLADDYPLREHCGKSKCVIECGCKGSTQPRIMRVETDGRSITTEDAFILRRKATARLARMEKEFTSTVVLTGNETLLINESQYDKKRRCTKAPKRYEDFADTEDDYTRPSLSPNKKTITPSGAMVTIEANESSSSTGFSEITTEVRELTFVKDTVLEQLKHCNVALVPFEDTKNMAVWCMVHELYKCFCGGRAVEGKPLLVEKEESNDTTEHNVSEDKEPLPLPIAKARYCFEKSEEPHKPKTTHKAKTEIEQEIVEPMPNTYKREKFVDSDAEEKIDVKTDSMESDGECDGKNVKGMRKHVRRGRPTELEKINEFFQMKPSFCRRAVPVPAKSYLRLNRKRRTQVHEYIQSQENKETLLLLNEHILRSVFFHRSEVKRQRKAGSINLPEEEENEEEPEVKMEPEARGVVELTDEDSRQSSVASSTSSKQSRKRANKRLRRLRMKEQWTERRKHAEEALQKAEKAIKDEMSEETSKKDEGSTMQPTESTSLPSVEETGSDEQPALNRLETESADDQASVADTATTASSSSPMSHMYKDFSLRAALTDEPSPSRAAPQLDTVNASAMAVGDKMSANFNRDFNNAVIRYMNNLVSKKMQDIDSALKRASNIIPAPNHDILCMTKWENFLGAFIEGFVFIWEVKTRGRSFLVATIKNIMPLVPDAMGVVNIAALQPQQLPLMGRMLLTRYRGERMHNLAVVMQGCGRYWLVRGFLRPDRGSVCQKPTPQSHPALTQKINVLYNLLLKQRVKEFQKKLLQKQEEREKLQQLEQQKQDLLMKKQQEEQRLWEANRGARNAAAATTQPKPKVVLKGQSSSSLLQNTTDAKLRVTQAATSAAAAGTSANGAQLPHQQEERKQMNVYIDALRERLRCDANANLKSNLEYRKVTKEDIDEIHEPEVYHEDHRWLVLDLYSDFSHVYLPDFRDLISLDRIHKMMAFSRQKQKIVKLLLFQDAPFNAFVTPSSTRKIYFGPLELESTPPVVVLLQSVDGNMMSRELYQSQHGITSNPHERTTAFWILRINGQTHFEFDAESASDAILETPSIEAPSNAAEESDDDCMIIENDAGTPVAGKDTNNFMIETSPSTNELRITQVKGGVSMPQPSQELPTSEQPFVPIRLPFSAPLLPTTLGSTPSLNLPPNAVITGMTAAPQDAPYAATIFISNVANGQQQIPILIGGPQEQIQPPLGNEGRVIASKTTFLTPDVCVTATAEGESLQQKAEGSKTNEARGFKRPQSATPTTTCSTPTYITPDVQVTTANGVSSAVPIKRRRYSIMGNAGSVGEKTPEPAAAPFSKSSTAFTDALPTVSTIGCTTITKLVTEMTAEDSSSQASANVAGEIRPIVMPVKFIDDACDEPEATIVFKRPHVNEVGHSETTTNTDIIPTKPEKVGVNNNKIYKRTSSGTIKVATTTTIANNSPMATDATKSSKLKLQLDSPLNLKLLTPKTIAPKMPTTMPAANGYGTVTATTATETAATAGTSATVSTMPNVKPIILNATTAGQQFSLKSDISPKTATVRPMQKRDALPIISSVKSMSPPISKFAKPTMIKMRSGVTMTIPPTRRKSVPAKVSPQSQGTNIQTSGGSIVGRAVPTQRAGQQNGDLPTATVVRTGSRLHKLLWSPAVKGQSGVFMCGVENAPKFDSKSISSSFVIKVPGIGSVELNSSYAANTYLNRHMLKLNKLWTDKMNTQWKFVPTVELQNERLTVNKTSKMVKVYPKQPTTTTNDRGLNNTKAMTNAVAAAAASNVLTDTILIED